MTRETSVKGENGRRKGGRAAAAGEGVCAARGRSMSMDGSWVFPLLLRRFLSRGGRSDVMAAMCMPVQKAMLFFCHYVEIRECFEKYWLIRSYFTCSLLCFQYQTCFFLLLLRCILLICDFRYGKRIRIFVMSKM